MGVTGLWQLVHPTGHPVTLESLEGKILAVDVSIWLNQLVKGMRDRHGNPLPNAHLLGLFRRVCKLLFYRIRPVFVFDGSVPALKKQTLVARRQRKVEAAASSSRANEKIVKTMLRHHALRAVLGETDDLPPSQKNYSAGDSQRVPPGTSQTEPSSSMSSGGSRDMFSLPPLPNTSGVNSSEMGDCNYEDEMIDDRVGEDLFHDTYQNLDDMDVESEEFKSLPPDVRHELLTELKFTRKHNSWAHINDLPQDSNDFSKYQFAKLMRQSKLSQHIDNVRKELNNQSSGDVATALVGGLHEGEIEARRVVSEDSSHYILIRGINREKHQGSCEKLAEVESDARVASPSLEEHKPANLTTNLSEEIKQVTEIESDEITEVGDWQDECKFGESKELLKQDVAPNDNMSKHSHVVANSLNDGASNDVEHINTGKGSDSKVSNYSMEGGFVREDSSDSEGDVQFIKMDMHHASNNSTQKEVDANAKSIPNETTVSIRSESRISLSSENSIDDVHSIDSLPTKETSVNACAAFNGANRHVDVVDISADDNIVNNDHLSPFNGPAIKPADFFNIAQRLSENVPLLPSDFGGSSAPAEQAQILAEIEGGSKIGDKRTASVADMLPEPGPDGKRAHKVNSANSSGKQTSEEPIVLGDSDSESDGDMIEITIDPSTAKPDDELFPPEIFLETSKESSLTPSQVEPQAEHENVPVASLEVVDMSTVEVDADQQETVEIADIPNEEPTVNEFEGMSQADLVELEQELAQEGEALRAVRGQQERLASSITDQMSAEAQDLLQLFGLPYIVSPTEAEAQCAQLDISGLTHGTITDDSDIWLFGGNRVYKNFFNQDKHVEFYRASDVHSRMTLDRHRLINLALLCGSDYTVGVEGIGPVTAMEVFAEFMGEDLEPLRKLKKWWDEAQKQEVAPSETKLKKKLRTLSFKPGFPSEVVVEAYLKPTVDDSTEPFSWARPDLDLLRTFAKERFGWPREKADEMLLPVMKQINSTQSQTHITSFFTADLGPPVALKSKRVKRILTLMKKNGQEEQNSHVESAQTQTKDEITKSVRGARGKPRGRARGRSEVSLPEAVKITNSCPAVKISERGRGRGKGKGRGKGSSGGGRGRGKPGKEAHTWEGARRAGLQNAPVVNLSESSSDTD